MAKIGIVTVLYNSSPVLEEFFLTLNKQTYKDFVLYVIDNKSSDNSLKETDRLSRIVDFKTIILPQTENGGVAKGNNIGIKAALEDNCDYVLLANNDIVLEKDTIEKLLEGLLRKKATLAVPKIYFWNTDKVLWTAGGKFLLLKGITCQFGYGEKDFGQYDKDTQVNYSPTCFMLIDSNVFHRVGVMDEKFFVYYDDTDFVWRALYEGHESLYYFYESKLYHKVSFSTGGEQSDFYLKYMSRNRVYFVLKNYSLLYCVCVLFFLFVKFWVKDIWKDNFKRVKMRVNAYKDGFALYFS